MLETAPLQTTLPAADLARAEQWYLDKLGLAPIERNDYGELVYEAGGSTFMVYRSEFAGSNQATAGCFSVEAFDETVDALRSRGVVFEDLDFGDWGKTIDGVITSADGRDKSAWFKDSEGNILNVFSRGTR